MGSLGGFGFGMIYPIRGYAWCKGIGERGGTIKAHFSIPWKSGLEPAAILKRDAPQACADCFIAGVTPSQGRRVSLHSAIDSIAGYAFLNRIVVRYSNALRGGL